jgi:effector-binding domain-containing protein
MMAEVINMKHFIKAILSIGLLMCGATNVMAIEEAAYTVIKKEDVFEVRDYAPHVVAEVVVSGTLEEAGDTAFEPLFNYISGDNKSRSTLAMTAPVSQAAKSEKIAMTAPVAQQQRQDKWVVSFMMPATYTLDTLPTPDDANVGLRAVPAHRVAAVRYSGFWSEKNYLKNKKALEAWIQKNNFTVVGDPVWARYNPPFKPWFLRRNEILIPIQ